MTSWALRPWPRPRRPPFGNPPSTVPWTRTMRPRTSTIEGCMRGVGLGRNYTCTICVSQKERWLTLEVHCHLDPRVLPVHHRAGPHLPEPSCLVEPDEVLLADEADGDQLWGGLLYKPHVRLEHPEPEPLAALRLGHADRVDAQGGPLGVVGAHALVGELAGLGQGAVDKPRHALALDGHHEEPPGCMPQPRRSVSPSALRHVGARGGGAHRPPGGSGSQRGLRPRPPGTPPPQARRPRPGPRAPRGGRTAGRLPSPDTP
mmetsp:Transcript_24320/g.76613  ORF Transcript_24320/g.76613 Transcript_24320/m.76613 type:complete len:260 (+) Transcript_24320:1859-2638(+)